MEGWERTPGELLEYISAYNDRMEQRAYLLYDLAGCIASMCFSKHPPSPAAAFPGFIRIQEMSEEQLVANCLAWAGIGEEAIHGGG